MFSSLNETKEGLFLKNGVVTAMCDINPAKIDAIKNRPGFEDKAYFENYIDMLVVLSRGPYSNVDGAAAGYGPDEWLELSDTIRRFHELTHVVCRRRYPEYIDPVRDELVADAVGIYAAFGFFDVNMEKLFLGITGRQYTVGRLENYTDEPEKTVETVCDVLGRIKMIVDEKKGAEPFDLIPELMKEYNSCFMQSIPGD